MPPEYTIEVARRLRRARLESGLSREQLARIVDTTATSLRLAESGRLDDFPAVTVARIGQTLGVSLAYLFGLDLLSTRRGLATGSER